MIYDYIIVVLGLLLVEKQCLISAACGLNKYQCNDGLTCILNSQLCDYNSDCPGVDDEDAANCQVDPTACPNTCTEGQYQCTDCSCVTSITGCPNQPTTEASNQHFTSKDHDGKKNRTIILASILSIGFVLITILIVFIVLYWLKKRLDKVDPESQSPKDS